MFPIHNEQMREKIRDAYSAAELEALQAFLTQKGAFVFTTMKTGLFPPPISRRRLRPTGYGNVWVRDNIHVAAALALTGRTDLADRAVLALAKFYADHSAKFFDIIEGGRSHHVPMHRPHIRFNGAELIESAERWPHAQNDALGYFVWFYAKRALEGAYPCDFALLEMFALYFERIAYWRDADSGHWEERAKVEASSIGAIVAALRLVQRLRETQGRAPWRRGLTDARLAALREQGEAALREILPWECRGPGALLARRYDAALLFLIYPLDVVDAGDGAHDLRRRRRSPARGPRRAPLSRRFLLDRRLQDASSPRTAGRRFQRQPSRPGQAGPAGRGGAMVPVRPDIVRDRGRRFLRTGAEADRREQKFRLQPRARPDHARNGNVPRRIT